MKFLKRKSNAGRRRKEAMLTVYRNGVMSFTKNAVEEMNLENFKYLQIGMDENNQLFIFLLNEKSNYTFALTGRKSGNIQFTASSVAKDINVKAGDKFYIKKVDKNVYKLKKKEDE